LGELFSVTVVLRGKCVEDSKIFVQSSRMRYVPRKLAGGQQHRFDILLEL